MFIKFLFWDNKGKEFRNYLYGKSNSANRFRLRIFDSRVGTTIYNFANVWKLCVCWQIRYKYDSGKIQDGFLWGGGLEIGFSDNPALKLIYQTIKTDVTYQDLDNDYTGNVSINYLLIGGTRYTRWNHKISGSGKMDLDAAWSKPDA